MSGKTSPESTMLDPGSQKTLAEQVAWLSEHWRPYRRELGILMALTVANAVVLVAYPLILKRIINGMIAMMEGPDEEEIRSLSNLIGDAAKRTLGES